MATGIPGTIERRTKLNRTAERLQDGNRGLTELSPFSAQRALRWARWEDTTGAAQAVFPALEENSVRRGFLERDQYEKPGACTGSDDRQANHYKHQYSAAGANLR